MPWCMHMHGTHVRSEDSWWVGSFLPPCKAQGTNSGLGLAAGALYPLKYLTGPQKIQSYNNVTIKIISTIAMG